MTAQGDSRVRPMSLRGHLLRLVLVTLVPMALLGAVLIGWLVTHQRDRIAAGVQETAKALALTLDREIAANIAALEALAGLDVLTSGDLRAFYERSQLAHRQHPYWNNIALIDAGGQQLTNTALPFGAKLPSVAHFDFVQRLIATRRPVVSDMIQGPVVSKPIIVVLVPVLRDGALKYILSAVVNPRTWSDLLAALETGPDMILTLSDSKDRVLARSRDADVFVGHQVPAWFIDARGGGQGLVRGPALDGREVVGAAFATRHAGWTLFAGVTVTSAYGTLDRTVLVASAAAVVLLGLSVGLAALAARRLSDPVHALAADGHKLAQREPTAADVRLPVRELDDLRRILAGAGSDLLRTAQEADRARGEAVRAADEAIRAQERAEKAERAKTQFLAAASHDLRQPVQSLYFFTQALAERLRGHPGAPLLASMEQALGALKLLLDGLLDVSKLDAGVVEPSVTECALAPLLERLSAEYGPRAEAQGLRFHVVATSAWVRTDPMLLERILRNLVENALRYTPQGGIVVGCRRGHGVVRLCVADTGIGIPETQQAAVFDEFVQIGNPERDRAKGLGLGLAIVRRLARLLGHEVHLRSRPGKGSVFAVDIPSARPRALPRRPVAIPANDGGKGLVVVIDDETIILLSLRAMLEQWGYTVVAAPSGDEAVALLQGLGQTPTMIIADYRLREGRTGVEAIRDIHGACGAPIPAVVLTGDTASERIAEVRNSGFRLVHKPITSTMLREVLGAMG